MKKSLLLVGILSLTLATCLELLAAPGGAGRGGSRSPGGAGGPGGPGGAGDRGVGGGRPPAGVGGAGDRGPTAGPNRGPAGPGGAGQVDRGPGGVNQVGGRDAGINDRGINDRGVNDRGINDRGLGGVNDINRGPRDLNPIGTPRTDPRLNNRTLDNNITPRVNDLNRVDRNNQFTQRNVDVSRNIQTQIRTLPQQAFSRDWYEAHPNSWQNSYPHADAYAAANWTSTAQWLAIAAAPVAYAYPTNTAYTSTNTTGDTQYAVTPDPVEQAQTASALAQTGRVNPAPSGTDWMPLGVFALVPGEGTTSNQMVQLQVSKAGQLGGSYLDLLSDSSSPVQGAVNKETQQVAWTIGKNNSVVFETAIQSLTQDNAPLAVRFGENAAQSWTLVRMPNQGN
ncbi:MAG TPA: hypothetical protein VL096_22195 [Pirellulaceae bacterium]|nr:hypothetical protein [Pirellulaceae bacterium]